MVFMSLRGQVKEENTWVSVEIMATFSPRTRVMLAQLPDTPQSRTIVQQMVEVNSYLYAWLLKL